MHETRATLPYAWAALATSDETTANRESFASRLRPPTIAGIAVLASTATKSLIERLSDLDIWWHLKTGELIVAAHRIPSGDPYSFTAAGKRWIVQEWGSEVLLHGIDSAFGLRGIIVWRSLMLLAIYGLAARLIVRHAGNTVGTWALVALTAYCGALSWTERPNLFSFLLFAITLTIAERKDKKIWWFVPIAALWANLHGMVVLGIGLVALLAILEWLKVALRWEGAHPAWAKRLGAVAAVGAVASLANPYGPGLHAHAFKLLKVVQSIITEWESPNFHELVPILFLVLVVATFAGMALGSRRPDPTDVGLAAAFLYLGLFAVRNLPVSAIVFGVVASKYLPDAIREAIARRRGGPRPMQSATLPAFNLFAFVAVVAAFAIIIANGYPRSNAPRDTMAPTFPVATIQSLDGKHARLFTTDVWAGLAIYLVWPDVHVSFDTRADFYGEEIIDKYQEVVSGGERWREQLDEWCVTHVLIPRRRPLATLIEADPDWTKQREEPVRKTVALLFERSAPVPGC
jgi:hypothetical protein